METNQLVTLMTGPGAAVLLMVMCGKWLTKRLEVADVERSKLVDGLQQVIRDNTTAMVSSKAASDAMVVEIRTLASTLASVLAQRDVSSPAIRVKDR